MSAERFASVPHLEESLRLARDLDAEFEVPLTLRDSTSIGGDEAAEIRSESEAILERLGAAAVPNVPLPSTELVPQPRLGCASPATWPSG